MRQSWRRAFGLASRALLVTLQRFLDVWFVFTALSGPCRRSYAPWLLLSGLAVTSILMAFTLQRHWSAMKRGRPHGPAIGILASFLQIAPLWEMLDKVLLHNRPRDRGWRAVQPSCLPTTVRMNSDGAGSEPGTASHSPRQPLLRFESPQTRSPTNAPRSDLPKGSPGEHIMRGVRKMSMVNLPEAMLSLWVHTSELVPVGDKPCQTMWQLGLGFAAAFLCAGFGIADFVLYIWVHDAFVRENKKLVTLHYCFELLSRVPAVVVFHVSYSRVHGYTPTLLLFLGDVLLTSVLLMISRMAKPGIDAVRCCLLSCISRQGVTQFLYSLVVSLQLFVVNVVFFDPGLSFFYVNQAYYVIKYMELAVMLRLIQSCRTIGVLHALSKVGLVAFCWGEVMAALVSAALVWCYVPMRRREKDVRLARSASAAIAAAAGAADKAEREAEAQDSSSDPFYMISPRAVEAAAASSHAPSRAGRILERLEETFELLLLLGRAACPRNRARLLDLVARDLWLQALRWDGNYHDGAGNIVHISVSGPNSAEAKPARGFSGPLQVPLVDLGQCGWSAKLDGPLISLEAHEAASSSQPHGSGHAASPRSGHFDGQRIVWQDGPSWVRCDVGSQASASKADSQHHGPHDQTGACAVLRLILPQLALALRWDVGPNALPTAGGVSPTRTGIGAVEGCGPLLSFLIQYPVMTRQADFLCELYWTLVCLSQDEASSQATAPRSTTALQWGSEEPVEEAPRGAYRTARRALVRAISGDWPAGTFLQVSARTSPGPLTEDADLGAFLAKVRLLLRGQRELWLQKMELLFHLGHHAVAPRGADPAHTSGTGSWFNRTEDFREALRRWPELRRKARRAEMDWQAEEDESLLASPHDADERARQMEMADLVNPGGLMSLPIDPAVVFLGVIPEESTVMPSKHAPLLFSCRTSAGPSTDVGGKEKYLLKVGDDLRQDQLILQVMALMACVWQERLPESDAKLLQLASFRVLAVTPRSGYVKFVPDAVPLSEALHQSQGNLVSWLERHRPDDDSMEMVLDTLCGSVAASCVVTYILGIGDRHLENLCVTRRGQFFHIDFSFVLGDDPKPCAPAARLPQQVAHALLTTERLDKCFSLAARAYLALRPFAGLWGSVLQLTAAAGGAGCSKLANEPRAAVSGVRERLRVDQADDELAASEFLCLMRESSEGLASILMDKVHAAGLFWR